MVLIISYKHSQVLNKQLFNLSSTLKVQVSEAFFNIELSYLKYFVGGKKFVYNSNYVYSIYLLFL